MSNNLDFFVDFYKQLISINSISSENPAEDKSNEEIINLLEKFLKSLNFKTEKILIKENPKKFNLIASFIPENYPISEIIREINGNKLTFNGHEGGIAFSGHTDTVPTDISKWHTNPFQAEIINNKLYGLGVIDMKGFFAFVAQILSNINFNEVKKPIYVLATADEETTMLGAQELSKTFRHKPDLIIIGEPTNREPIIMHKGHIVQTISVTGQSGHSSDPNAGLNAIKIMHQVIGCILELENTLKTKYQERLFPISYPTLNLGVIQGGDAPNRICETCELTFDIRPIPSLSSKICLEETRNALKYITSNYPDCIKINLPYAPVEAFDGQLSNELITIIETFTNKKVKAVNYATEATYLQKIAPTIILGAGDIATAHQANEYLDLNEVNPMLDTLENILKKIAC